MLDWSTIASLATAGGTLVLAIATFASVRSGSRTAGVAEDGRGAVEVADSVIHLAIPVRNAGYGIAGPR